MIITIWTLKCLVAFIFAFVGTNKMLLPKSKLLEKGMKGLVNLDDRIIKTAGVLEVLGAIGIIFPTILNFYPVLSIISAFCLGLTMIVAGVINYTLKLSIVPNILIFIICIFIAICELKLSSN